MVDARVEATRAEVAAVVVSLAVSHRLCVLMLTRRLGYSGGGGGQHYSGGGQSYGGGGGGRSYDQQGGGGGGSW